MKKRGKPVLKVKDFLRAESIDELVSSEERELFRMKRFISRQMILQEIEQQQKQKKPLVRREKAGYSSKKQKEIDYKPLKYKPITYIPLKKRNMFRYRYSLRLKRGRKRRIKMYYSGRLRRQRNNFRQRANNNKMYSIDKLVQNEPPITSAIPLYKIERQGYGRNYRKVAA